MTKFNWRTRQWPTGSVQLARWRDFPWPNNNPIRARMSEEYPCRDGREGSKLVNNNNTACQSPVYTYITEVTVTECADRGLTDVRGRGRSCGWRTPLSTAADRREARRYDDGGHMPFLGGIARRPAVTRHHVTTTACPTLLLCTRTTRYRWSVHSVGVSRLLSSLYR